MRKPWIRTVVCLASIVLLVCASFLVSGLPMFVERNRDTDSSVDENSESSWNKPAMVDGFKGFPYKSSETQNRKKAVSSWDCGEKKFGEEGWQEELELDSVYASSTNSTQIAEDHLPSVSFPIPDHEICVSLQTRTLIRFGETALLNMTILNEGNNNETNLVLRVFINETEVKSYVIPELVNFTGQLFLYPWTPALEGIYNVTVFVAPVAGETNTQNNKVTKFVDVRTYTGLILWDRVHATDNPYYYSQWLESLTPQGYLVTEHLWGNITSTTLAHIDILVIARARYHFRSSELAAIEAFVQNGGGLLVIGDDDPTIHTSLTQFVGINWTWEGQRGGICSNITPHAVTVDVWSTYTPYSYDRLQVFGPALSLIRNDEGATLLAASAISSGRVLCIANEDIIRNYRITEEDNLQLATNMIGWLNGDHYPHELGVRLSVPLPVEPDKTTIVNASIRNFGSNTEYTVLLQLLINDLEADSLLIPSFSSQMSYTLSFLWTPDIEGFYNVTAYVAPLPNENRTSNNVEKQMILVLPIKNYQIYERLGGPWYDAKLHGDNLYLQGDDVSASIELPFYFPFYNRIFTTVYVSSNGWLSFDNTNPYQYNNPTFPTVNSHFAYALAPYWDDLRAENNIYYWLTPDRVVIQYDTYYTLGGEHVGTFQVVLHVAGHIEFNYLYIYTITDATVGLNCGDGISFNTFPPSDLWCDVTNVGLLFSYQPIAHDLAVSVEGPPVLKVGDSWVLKATLVNYGTSNETAVDLCLYINSIMATSTVIPVINSLDAYELEYPWNPSMVGIYNITAYVVPRSNESSVRNNIDTKDVIVSAISGRILFDYNHGNLHYLDFGVLINSLHFFGVIIDYHTSGELSSALLADYQVLICAGPSSTYSTDELIAIERFVRDGGGLLVIGNGEHDFASTLTGFAGMIWVEDHQNVGLVANFTEHEITYGINVIFVGETHCRIQSSSSVFGLTEHEGQVILAYAKPGGGVIGLASAYCLSDEFILRRDNLILGVNIITWLLLLEVRQVNPVVVIYLLITGFVLPLIVVVATLMCLRHRRRTQIE